MTDKEKHVAKCIIVGLTLRQEIPKGVKFLRKDTGFYEPVWNVGQPLSEDVYDHIVSHFKKELRRNHCTEDFNKMEHALQVFETEITVGGK